SAGWHCGIDGENRNVCALCLQQLRLRPNALTYGDRHRQHDVRKYAPKRHRTPRHSWLPGRHGLGTGTPGATAEKTLSILASPEAAFSPPGCSALGAQGDEAMAIVRRRGAGHRTT